MTVADRKPFSLRQVAWGISLFAVAAGLWLGLTLFLRSRAERLPPTSASRVAVAEEAPAAAPPTAVAPPAEVADAGSAPRQSSIEVESAKLVWGCRGDVDKVELVVLPEIEAKGRLGAPRPFEPDADPADPLTPAAEAERYLTPRSNDWGE
jgi:hypothetical protein